MIVPAHTVEEGRGWSKKDSKAQMFGSFASIDNSTTHQINSSWVKMDNEWNW